MGVTSKTILKLARLSWSKDAYLHYMQAVVSVENAVS